MITVIKCVGVYDGCLIVQQHDGLCGHSIGDDLLLVLLMDIFRGIFTLSEIKLLSLSFTLSLARSLTFRSPQTLLSIIATKNVRYFALIESFFKWDSSKMIISIEHSAFWHSCSQHSEHVDWIWLSFPSPKQIWAPFEGLECTQLFLQQPPWSPKNYGRFGFVAHPISRWVVLHSFRQDIPPLCRRGDDVRSTLEGMQAIEIVIYLEIISKFTILMI